MAIPHEIADPPTEPWCNVCQRRRSICICPEADAAIGVVWMERLRAALRWILRSGR